MESNKAEPEPEKNEKAKMKLKTVDQDDLQLSPIFRTVVFLSPVVILFLSVAAYTSEHWVDTNTTSHWGLMTRCLAKDGSPNGTAVCSYIQVGDYGAYFEAARVLASLALVLSVALTFQHALVKVPLCRHQLPALLTALHGLCLMTVLMLVGVNYTDDNRWSDQDPTLGWSFFLAMTAAILSFIVFIAVTYVGKQMHFKTVAKERVHPLASKSPRLSKDLTALEAGGREAEVGGRSTAGPGGASVPDPLEGEKRPWKRRLSPILERKDRDGVEGCERGSQASPRDDSFSASPRIGADP